VPSVLTARPQSVTYGRNSPRAWHHRQSIACPAGMAAAVRFCSPACCCQLAAYCRPSLTATVTAPAGTEAEGGSEDAGWWCMPLDLVGGGHALMRLMQRLAAWPAGAMPVRYCCTCKLFTYAGRSNHSKSKMTLLLSLTETLRVSPVALFLSWLCQCLTITETLIGRARLLTQHAVA
jgi:hypothetical protein